MDKNLVSMETKHSRDVLLPNILPSVLILFFSILFDFAVFTPPNLNYFSASILSEI